MDFLDPAKQRAHRIRLLVGYVLLAIAVALAAVVLLYQAHGFGVRQGKVIQNGLVFVQSTPGAADIELNGQNNGTTNARLVLEAGAYTMKLSREGYHDWQRALTVEGGGVEHFTYPFLVPRELTPRPVTTYDAAPSLATQSPDRRWLLVQQPGQIGSFDLYDTQAYDVKEPEKSKEFKKSVAIPAVLFTLPAAEPRSLEVVDWSNDNKHVVLRHIAGDQSEYILFSHEKPAESANLTTALQLTPNLVLSLQDKKYDRYFIHDTVAKTLSTASLSDPQSLPMLTNVLAYKTYGNDTVLYTAPVTGQADKVQVRLFQGKRQYPVRTIAAGETYLLGLSRYEGDWLLMAGTPSESRVYVYKNTAEALQAEPTRPPVPVAVLKIANPTVAAFSANSQLIMAQGGSGTDFAVYDAKYDRTHVYQIDKPMDAPQAKAAWLDSHHLHYVSGGKAIIFDYDGTNLHELAAQNPALPPLYDTGYTVLYSLAAPATPDPAQPAAHVLSATPLRTVADQ